MIKLLTLVFLIPVVSFSQTIKYRQYKPGEITRYKLTSEIYHNGKSAGKTVSIAGSKVVNDSGYFSEEIRRLSKISISVQDTINLDSIGIKVKPCKIFLSPNGKVLLPKLAIPEMVGDITDLNTFYVAISPALNAQKISVKKPKHINDKTIKGNFADSVTILYGTDCIRVMQNLVSATKRYSVIKTGFEPPSFSCLLPLLDTIEKKTFDYSNNFQMIRKGTDNKVNLVWGVETFTIITDIDNKNGQILAATMTNFLNLRMRYNASKDLKTYAAEIPFTITRNLKLELLAQ